MQRQRGELVPIGEVVSGLDDGPVKSIREASPQARHHFTRFDQVNQLVGGMSRSGVENYSKGSVCDLPGVTSGTASAAMKRPFFGAWASGTTATVMAKIETRAMGFLATPKAKPVHSLASASTPDFGTSGLA